MYGRRFKRGLFRRRRRVIRRRRRRPFRRYSRSNTWTKRKIRSISKRFQGEVLKYNRYSYTVFINLNINPPYTPTNSRNWGYNATEFSSFDGLQSALVDQSTAPPLSTQGTRIKLLKCIVNVDFTNLLNSSAPATNSVSLQYRVIGWIVKKRATTAGTPDTFDDSVVSYDTTFTGDPTFGQSTPMITIPLQSSIVPIGLMRNINNDGYFTVLWDKTYTFSAIKPTHRRRYTFKNLTLHFKNFNNEIGDSTSYCMRNAFGFTVIACSPQPLSTSVTTPPPLLTYTFQASYRWVDN